jgi:hypothetical protein
MSKILMAMLFAAYAMNAAADQTMVCVQQTCTRYDPWACKTVCTAKQDPVVPVITPLDWDHKITDYNCVERLEREQNQPYGEAVRLCTAY